MSINELEIEEDEMNEAAMSLVMFSEQVSDFDLTHGDDDDSMDLDKFKLVEDKVLDCVESILDFREMVSDHSGFEKFSNWSDVVAMRSELQSKSSHICKICGKRFECYQALGGHQRLHRPINARKRKYTKDDNSLFESLEAKKIVSESSFEVSQKEKKILDCELLPLNSKLQKRLESSSSYKCQICGKSFGCYQALGGHKRLHRSMKGELARTEDDNSLSYSSEAKKIVSQPSSFLVSHEEKILHCVESKQDFSELVSHSGFNKSSSCNALPITLRSKLQEKTQSNSSCDCKTCGKSFECYQALGGHQRLHRPLRGKLARKKDNTKDDNSLFNSSEAKKIVSQPSNLEVSQEEKILHCVESKQDFSELFTHSGFDKSSSCTKTRFIPPPCCLRSKSHSNISINEQLVRKMEKTQDGTRLFEVPDDSEASRFVSQPLSCFEEVSREEKILHCVESKQDYSVLLSYSGSD